MAGSGVPHQTARAGGTDAGGVAADEIATGDDAAGELGCAVTAAEVAVGELGDGAVVAAGELQAARAQATTRTSPT